MTTIFDTQLQSDRLRKLLRTNVEVGSAPSEVYRLLSAARSDFSTAHLTHDIVQFLKSFVKRDASDLCHLKGIVAQLSSKFHLSFRPSARDVIEVCSLFVGPGEWALSPLLDVLGKCLLNQQGNPKLAYSLVAEAFLPLLARLEKQTIECNAVLVQGVIAGMFHSLTNVMLVSAYLVSRTSEPEPKKQKMGGAKTVYVSTLFEKLQMFTDGSHVHRMVLREFVCKKRQFPGAATVDEFAFFLNLCESCPSLRGRLELWIEMSALFMYRLREDDRHKLELGRLLDDVLTCGEADFWEGLETALKVDPVSFTERIAEVVFKSLSASPGAEACLSTLFSVFACKGSLLDLVTLGLQFPNAFSSVCPHRVCAGLMIAPADFVAVLELLFPLCQTSAFAVRLLPALIRTEVRHLPSNLRVSVNALFEANLDSLTVYFSGSRDRPAQLAQLIVAIVDGIRQTRTAWSDPMNPSMNSSMNLSDSSAGVCSSLSMVARKDAQARGAALVRLLVLSEVAVTATDLLDSAGTGWVEFMEQSHLNRSAVLARLKNDPMLAELEALVKDELPQATTKHVLTHMLDTPEFELNGLLLQTSAILKAHPRLPFAPPSLRKGGFPMEILVLEAAWANQCGTLNKLVAQLDSLPAALYGLSVILEELKRGGGSVSVESQITILQALPTLNPLAQSRCLLALHALKPSAELAERLALLSVDILSMERDSHAIQAGYLCLLQAVQTLRDKRKIRLPWWTCKVHVILVGLRGLIGSAISAPSDDAKTEAAHCVVRIWKSMTDSFSKEKNFRFSKSIPLIAGEYIRLSGKVINPAASAVLDKGCCGLLEKLDKDEQNFLHAMLGKNDREILKRLVALLESSFKYKGKV